jgi:hypothetical protein
VAFNQVGGIAAGLSSLSSLEVSVQFLHQSQVTLHHRVDLLFQIGILLLHNIVQLLQRIVVVLQVLDQTIELLALLSNEVGSVVITGLHVTVFLHRHLLFHIEVHQETTGDHQMHGFLVDLGGLFFSRGLLHVEGVSCHSVAEGVHGLHVRMHAHVSQDTAQLVHLCVMGLSGIMAGLIPSIKLVYLISCWQVMRTTWLSI